MCRQTNGRTRAWAGTGICGYVTIASRTRRATGRGCVRAEDVVGGRVVVEGGRVQHKKRGTQMGLRLFFL